MKHYHINRLQRVLDGLHTRLKVWCQSAWMETPEWQQTRVDTEQPDDETLIKADTHTCGTAGCLAGWGALAAGATFVGYAGGYLEYIAPRGQVRAVLSGREEPVHVRVFAADYFGLSHREASAQFDSENSYARLWALAMLFTGGRLTIPVEVTSEQAEGASGQGSQAWAAENFPAEVLEDMRRLIRCEFYDAVRLMLPEERLLGLDAASEQAEARAAAIA